MVPFEEERRAATVLSTKRAGTFTYQATILINGESDVSTSKGLDLHHKFELASLEGQDMVWVAAKYIKPGHVLSWWEHYVTVEAVEQQGNAYFLTMTDPVEKKQKRFEYKPDDECHVKIAEPSEEKKAWRERRLSEHMLPPIKIHLGESPEEFSKRIMRQMEEWTDN